MILFERDFARYPRAIIHLNTRNKSFVRLAALYREMGVKNNAFFLALIHPELEFVNPHDPHLSLELQALVIAECRMNPFYYVRECLRAPASGGAEPMPFEANRGNIALYFCFFNHVFTFLIQIRQTGKSFSTYGLMSYLLNIGTISTQINWLTKDDKLRREGIQLLKDIMDDLPRFLDMRGRDDVNNGEEITINALRNKFITHVPQSSEKRALNQGRGLTTSIIVGDEGPFQANFHIALPAALGARSAAVDKAKAEGAPYGVIMATTAGKKDTKEGKFVFEMLQECMEFDEMLFDCVDAADLDRVIRLNSPKGLYQVNITLSAAQLGKSEEWLKNVIAESKQTGEAADRDYFNRWTSGTNSSPFDPEDAEIMRKSTRAPAHTEISLAAYITKWYVPKEQINQRMGDRNTVMSLDTSEASGGDDISLTIVDLETGETLAAGTYNETNIIRFSEWICSIIVAYPKMTTIIERRSTGSAVLDYLLLMLPTYGVDPFRRLFNRCVQEFDEDKERYAEISIPMNRRDQDCYVRFKKTFGFATSGSGEYSRTGLYSTTLQAAVKNVGMKMHDKKLVDQALGLEIKNGRIDHSASGHDDTVIGWLLAHWFATQARNTQFYGINASRVYCDIRPKKVLSGAEYYQQVEQENLRKEITELMEKLASEPDEFVIMRMEQRLRGLTQRVIAEANEVFSIDQLIAATREERLKRRRERGAGGMRSHQYHDQRMAQDRRFSAGDITVKIENAENSHLPHWRR